jgi:hypothetical protein
MALPTATVTETAPYTAQPAVVPVELTPDDLAKVDALYEELKPEATLTARNYVLNRTPALYQEAMVEKIEADWPAPPVEDEALVESRLRDRESYKRPADPNPNLDPNLPPVTPVQPAPAAAPYAPQAPLA